MIFNDIISLEKNTGKLEVFLGKGAGWKKVGTFREEYNDICSDCESYGASYFELNLKRMKINIAEKIADSGYKITNAVMKTKNHWYEKWEETPLKNVSVIQR